MNTFGKHITKKNNKIAKLILLTVFTLTGCGISKVEAGEKPASEKPVAIAEATVSEESSISEKTVPEAIATQPATDETDAEQAVYERVIALSKSNAELWILAGGKLIATSDDALEIDGLNEDVISLGDMNKVSLEAITALEPDLLILFSTEPPQKALGEAAEAIGINVYYTNIDGFADYENVMTDLTGYSGHPDSYEENVSDVRAQIDDVLEKVPEDAEEKTYLLLHVSATKSKVEKNDYFACEIFNDLGLKNIAEDDSSFDELSLEAIVAADPDYIFVVPRGSEKKALESFDQLFTSQPAWSSLSAVDEGRYYLLSKDLFGLKPNAAWGKAYSKAYDLLY